jgi:cytochrome c
MDAFELNKIAGAVLTALLVVFGGKTMLDIVYKEHKPEKAGWALPITEAPTSSGGGATQAAAFDPANVLALLPKASADAGQDVFKRCLQCHTPDKGGRNLVGPNLWGIVGRKVGEVGGFPYSDAMKTKGGDWDWSHLAAYLHDPKAAIPGNKMAFPGIKDDAELADLLIYVRKLADAPAALPK